MLTLIMKLTFAVITQVPGHACSHTWIVTTSTQKKVSPLAQFNFVHSIKRYMNNPYQILTFTVITQVSGHAVTPLWIVTTGAQTCTTVSTIQRCTFHCSARVRWG